jgi:hypothetical protein
VVVFEVAADPQTWPGWAAGLAAGGLRQEAEGGVADSPMGAVTVVFSPPNRFGVLDHVVRMPSGGQVYNPLRVVPGGVGAAECEVVFSVRRRPGMTDDEFDADAAAVAADLTTLARLAFNSAAEHAQRCCARLKSRERNCGHGSTHVTWNINTDENRVEVGGDVRAAAHTIEPRQIRSSAGRVFSPVCRGAGSGVPEGGQAGEAGGQGGPSTGSPATSARGRS